jgi:hypothetical protein
VVPSGITAVLCLLLFLSACATVGRDFPASRVPEIQIGKTTQAEIKAMFGTPWRVGMEDGMRTWTYGKYFYSAFSPASTKDLVIRFDANNIVKSYTFNTTDASEIKK